MDAKRPPESTDLETATRLLQTDLYQLTMLQAYHDRGMTDTAVFEFFVRRLPEQRNFLIAAGLEQVVDFLAGARFADDELEWLGRSGYLRPDFVERLAEWRFTGDVDAMAEGTLVLPDEPILRVCAPLPEAQLVETRIVNLLQFQTLIASKAARCVLAAPDRVLVDFGLRRAHGAEAGLLSARASYLAGFAGTSNVLAGKLWGVPLYGTMAHSYVQAHQREDVAFEDFARSHPTANTMLIDTYDTEDAAARLAPIAERLAREGIDLQAVRLDSGDLGAHARKVRRILDAEGLGAVKIFASGGLDEYRLRDLADAPIDGYGVGTHVNTSADAPYLDCAYKLQEYAGQARRKLSEGKATWPGRKQVFRRHDARAGFHDELTLLDEARAGEALLQPVMRGGERIAPAPALAELRAGVRSTLAELPAPLRALDEPAGYRPEISDAVRRLADTVDRRARSA